MVFPVTTLEPSDGGAYVFTVKDNDDNLLVHGEANTYVAAQFLARVAAAFYAVDE